MSNPPWQHPPTSVLHSANSVKPVQGDLGDTTHLRAALGDITNINTQLSSLTQEAPVRPALSDVTNGCLKRSDPIQGSNRLAYEKRIPSSTRTDVSPTTTDNGHQVMPFLTSPSDIQSSTSNLKDQLNLNKRARERYASMDPKKKEAYLKKKRENYHKRKALMTPSATGSVAQNIVPAILPVDSSPVTPQNTNVSFQLARPPIGVSQKASTPLILSPMVVSQQGSKQLLQSPMEASQISYCGRNLLKSFQNVMASPSKHS